MECDAWRSSPEVVDYWVRSRDLVPNGTVGDMCSVYVNRRRCLPITKNLISRRGTTP